MQSKRYATRVSRYNTIQQIHAKEHTLPSWAHHDHYYASCLACSALRFGLGWVWSGLVCLRPCSWEPKQSEWS